MSKSVLFILFWQWLYFRELRIDKLLGPAVDSHPEPQVVLPKHIWDHNELLKKPNEVIPHKNVVQRAVAAAV